MPSSEILDLTLRSRNRHELPSTCGTLTLIHFDKKDRTRNAVRTSLLWLAISFGAVLVPFWHFFLVPAFFITAWVLGIEKWSEKSRNDGGEGSCPHCKNPIRIAKSAWKGRLTDTCESCFEDLEISLQTADR